VVGDRKVLCFCTTKRTKDTKKKKMGMDVSLFVLFVDFVVNIEGNR